MYKLPSLDFCNVSLKLHFTSVNREPNALLVAFILHSVYSFVWWDKTTALIKLIHLNWRLYTLKDGPVYGVSLPASDRWTNSVVTFAGLILYWFQSDIKLQRCSNTAEWKLQNHGGVWTSAMYIEVLQVECCDKSGSRYREMAGWEGTDCWINNSPI